MEFYPGGESFALFSGPVLWNTINPSSFILDRNLLRFLFFLPGYRMILWQFDAWPLRCSTLMMSCRIQWTRTWTRSTLLWVRSIVVVEVFHPLRELRDPVSRNSIKLAICLLSKTPFLPWLHAITICLFKDKFIFFLLIAWASARPIIPISSVLENGFCTPPHTISRSNISNAC